MKLLSFAWQVACHIDLTRKEYDLLLIVVSFARAIFAALQEHLAPCGDDRKSSVLGQSETYSS